MRKKDILSRIDALEAAAEPEETVDIVVTFMQQRPGAEAGDWEGATEVEGFRFPVKVPKKRQGR